jgi:hypothetical protein
MGRLLESGDHFGREAEFLAELDGKGAERGVAADGGRVELE